MSTRREPSNPESELIMQNPTPRRAFLRIFAVPIATSVTASLANVLVPSPALANPNSAKQVVETMVTQALGVLRDPAMQNKREERKKRLRAIADVAFDWEALARSSLGHYWRGLEPAQRTEFVSVFKDLLANQYMDDIDRFQGNEKVNVLSATAKGHLVEVKTTLTTGSAERVPMNYTLHDVNKKWMIEDVSIEGVSMVKHYRSTFKRFLVNKSFAELMEVLKRKLGAS